MRSLCFVVVAVSLLASRSAAQATLVNRFHMNSAQMLVQLQSISDLDGDGRRDLILRDSTIAWAESSRNIGTVLQSYSPLTSGMFFVLYVAPVVDADGDGVEELVFTVAGGPSLSGLVRLLSGRTGAPLLEFGPPIGELTAPTRAVCAGDIDADGHTDLIVEFSYGPGLPRFVRIHSGANGASMRSYPSLTLDQARAFGDFNGDGHDDLLLGGATSTRVHSGADDSVLRDFVMPAGSAWMGTLVYKGCDHDADGFPEPVVLSDGGAPGTVHWNIFSSSTAQLLHSITPAFPSGIPATWSSAATCCGDVDGDGIHDYTMFLGGSGGSPIYSSATNANLGNLGAFPLGMWELGDVNNDGVTEVGYAGVINTHGYSHIRAVLLGQPAPIASCAPPPPPPGAYEFVHVLAGSTSLSVGDRLVSTAECVPQGSRVLFVVGSAAVSNPVGVTNLCVGGRRVLLETERIDIGGWQCDQFIRHSWSRERISALGVAPGDTLHTQFVLLDPTAAPSARVRTSSAVSITFAP